MDYRELLKKYIKYIKATIETDGVENIAIRQSLWIGEIMTKEEIEEITKIAEEVE